MNQSSEKIPPDNLKIDTDRNRELSAAEIMKNHIETAQPYLSGASTSPDNRLFTYYITSTPVSYPGREAEDSQVNLSTFILDTVPFVIVDGEGGVRYALLQTKREKGNGELYLPDELAEKNATALEKTLTEMQACNSDLLLALAGHRFGYSHGAPYSNSSELRDAWISVMFSIHEKIYRTRGEMMAIDLSMKKFQREDDQTQYIEIGGLHSRVPIYKTRIKTIVDQSVPAAPHT